MNTNGNGHAAIEQPLERARQSALIAYSIHARQRPTRLAVEDALPYPSSRRSFQVYGSPFHPQPLRSSDQPHALKSCERGGPNHSMGVKQSEHRAWLRPYRYPTPSRLEAPWRQTPAPPGTQLRSSPTVTCLHSGTFPKRQWIKLLPFPVGLVMARTLPSNPTSEVVLPPNRDGPVRGGDAPNPYRPGLESPSTSGGRRIIVAHVMTVPVSLTFLRGQAAFMAAWGIGLHAVASPGLELERWGFREHVPVHPIPMQRRISPLQDLVAVWRLVGLFRRIRPDIVHAHTPKGGLLGMLAAWLARVPRRIYHIRGLPYVVAGGSRRLLLKTTERVSCRLAHRVLAVSGSMRDLASADRIYSP